MSNAHAFGKRQPRVAAPVAAAAGRKPRVRAKPDAAPVTEPGRHWPLFTAALLLLLTLVFLLQEHLGGGHAPDFALDARTLTMEGGVDRYLVLQQGEWWRIFTAPLLHGSLSHIVNNGVVLAIAGWLLERFVGRGWLALLFFAGAVGGSFGSMLYGSLISVGASGAIMALLAALFVVSYHDQVDHKGRRLRRFALYLLIPALLPSAAQGGVVVDIGAHFGGAITGTILGFAMLILWHEDAARPPLAKEAAMAGLGGMLVAVLAFIPVGGHYAAHAAQTVALIPASEMPNSIADAERDAGDLAERYPHDPRARLFRALNYLRHRDAADAVPDLRAAIKEFDAHPASFPAAMRDQLQAVLAVALLAQGRLDAARTEGRSVCNSGSNDELLGRMRQLLAARGVCA
jgi:rhomboid protease GluP